MSSDKQLILIILTAIVALGWQWYKDEKKKNEDSIVKSRKKLDRLKYIIKDRTPIKTVDAKEKKLI